MNSSEIKSLLRSAVRSYLAPETLRPNESIAEAATRQNAALRELFEELKRYQMSTANSAAAGLGMDAVAIPNDGFNEAVNDFHAEALQHAETLIAKKMYRAALLTCLATYRDHRNDLDETSKARAAHLARLQAQGVVQVDATSPHVGPTSIIDFKTALLSLQPHQKLTTSQLTELELRRRSATYTAVCKFFLLLEADPELEHGQTMGLLLEGMTDVTDCIQSALPHDEKQYHIIYNATVYVLQMALELIHLGWYRQPIVHIAYCARVCDAVLPLATVKYVSWRVRLYTTVSYCYEQLQNGSAALQIAQHLLQQVTDLHELEMLDVVPPPPQQVATLETALQDARLLVLKYSWHQQLEARVGTPLAATDSKQAKGGRGKDGGAVVADTNSLTQIPGSAQELIDQVRRTLRTSQTTPTRQASKRLVQFVLAAASDCQTRLVPRDGTNVTNQRLAPLRALALEALLLLVSNPLEDFMRSKVQAHHLHPATNPTLMLPQAADDATKTEAIGANADEASGKGDKIKSKAKSGKDDTKTKTSGASTKQQSSAIADDGWTLPWTFEELFVKGDDEAEQLSPLGMHAARFAFTVSLNNKEKQDNGPFATVERLLCALRVLYSFEVDPKTDNSHATAISSAVASCLELQLLESMIFARRSSKSAASIFSLVTDLRNATSNEFLSETRKELLEDASLLTLSLWEGLENCYELPDAASVLKEVIRGLLVSDHADVLRLGNLTTTATRLLLDEQTREGALVATPTREALSIVRLVYDAITARQEQFVFNYNSRRAALSIDVLGERVDKSSAATLQDGMWLRTLRDLRTELCANLCRLRMHVAVHEKHQSNLNEHARKVELMKSRDERSHIFGELSKRERRVFEALTSMQHEPPCTVDQMQRKLVAWGTNASPLHLAAVLVELAKCQPSIELAVKFLEDAEGALTVAHEEQDSLRSELIADYPGKNAEDIDVLEATGMTALSLYMVWASFFVTCQTYGAWKLIERNKQKGIIARFVQSGPRDQEPWNVSPCAVNGLRLSTCQRCSPLMCKAVALAMVAIADSDTSRTPLLNEDILVDSAELGVDPDRFRLKSVQQQSILSANTLLLAVELVLATKDEQTLLMLMHRLFNSCLPLLTPRTKSSMVLRPLTVLLHCFGMLQPRRWADGPLQLLAARTIDAAIDCVGQLSDSAQRPLQRLLCISFVKVWKLVQANPNVRQLRHIRTTQKDIVLLDRIINAKLKRPSDGAGADAGAVAKAAAPKPSAKVPGGKTATGAVGAKDDLASYTIYLRSEVFFADTMPVEYLALFDKMILSVPGTIGFCEAESQAVFPQCILSTLSAFASAPQSGISRLMDFRNDPLYPKVASMIASLLLKNRQLEAAVALCIDALREIRLRHEGLDSLATELTRSFREFLSSAGLLDMASETKVSIHERAVGKLTRRLGEYRRKLAVRRLRALHLQYDVPFQAFINWQLSLAQQMFSASGLPNLAVIDKSSYAPAPPAAAAGAKAPPGKPSPSAQGSSMNAAMRATPRGGSVSTSNVEESALQAARESLLKTASKALVLFNRTYCAQHSYCVLLHINNVCRSSFGVEPPNTLQDFTGATKKDPTSGGTLSVRSGGSSTAKSSSPVPAIAAASAAAATSKTAEAFLKVEKIMKVTAAEVLNMLQIFENELALPSKELEALQPVCIKVGRDFTDGRSLLQRSTSIHAWLSPRGQFEEARIKALDLAADQRDLKIHLRVQQEFAEEENWNRIALVREWATEFGEITDLVPDLADLLGGQFSGSSASGSRSNATSDVTHSVNEHHGAKKTSKTKKAVKIAVKPLTETSAIVSESAEGVYQEIPFERNLGKLIRLDEIVRCFVYAVKAMQYGQRKLSALSLTLDFNSATRNHFATAVLPYALNLLNATAGNTEKTMLLYLAGSREQVRSKKMTEDARRALAQYKESEAFRRVMTKLSNTLLPARRAQATPAAADFETQSVASTAQGGGGGNSQYKDVVGQYSAAVTYLRQKNSTQLLVELLFELGTFHLLHRNKSEAERSWNDAVDATVGRVGALRAWRDLLQDKKKLLHTMGLLKCVVAAACLGSLAMYIYHENQRKATDACLFAAELIMQLADTALAFPQRDWDHSASLREIMPNVELDVDLAECMPAICHALAYISDHLASTNFPQHSVAAANVCEYVANRYIRSTQYVVLARCIKARALAAGTNFASAFALLVEVGRGRNVPDTALGAIDVVVNVVDTNEAGTGGPVGGQGKSGATQQAAKKTPGPAKSDEMSATSKTPAGLLSKTPGGFGADADVLVDYDNSKPPSNPQNLRAIESIMGFAFQPTAPTTAGGQGGFSLHEAVAAEYGGVLGRHVLLTAVEVLIHLGSADVLSSWASESAVDSAAQAAAQTGSKGAKPPAGKSGLEGKPQAQDVCGFALATAERILQAFYTSGRPVSAPQDKKSAAAAAAAAAAPSAASQLQAPSPVEDAFLKLRARYYFAVISSLRGAHVKSAEHLEAVVAAHNKDDSTTLNVRDVPSFVMWTPARFFAASYALLSWGHLQLQRWNAARKAAQTGLAIADQCRDSFAARQLQENLLVALLRSGQPDEAIGLSQQLCETGNQLDLRGIDGRRSVAISELYRLVADTVEQPRLNSPPLLQGLFSATNRKKVIEDLLDSAEGLRRRAESFGLNMSLDAVAKPHNVHRYNRTIAEYHTVLTQTAVVASRIGRVGEAIDLLRKAVMISRQFDATRYPTMLAITTFQLARLLRQQLQGENPRLFATITTESAIPQASQQKMTLDDSTVTRLLADSHPLKAEIASLLLGTIDNVISCGIHTHELLRLCFIELFAVLSSVPALHPVAGSALSLACLTAKMAEFVFNNTSALDVNAGPTGTIQVDDLPPAVQLILEDFSKREGFNQSEYIANNAERAQLFAAQSTLQGKATGSNPSPVSWTAPLTLSVVLSTFASLHRSFATSLPQDLLTQEALLIKLRQFLQSKTPPSTIQSCATSLESPLGVGGVAPAGTSAVQQPPAPIPFVFEKTPRLAPQTLPRANFVFIQNSVMDTIHAPGEVVEGVWVDRLPPITMLIAVSQISEAVDTRDSEALTTTGKSAVKPPVNKAATSNKSVSSDDDATSALGGKDPVALPPLCVALVVPQNKLRALHQQAKDLVRRLQQLCEAGPATLDDVIEFSKQDVTRGAASAAGGKSVAGGKGGAQSVATGSIGAPQSALDPADSATPSPGKSTATSFVIDPIDELKSEVIFAFIDLLMSCCSAEGGGDASSTGTQTPGPQGNSRSPMRKKSGANATSSLIPPGGISDDVLNFLSKLLNPAGGAASLASQEIHRWMFQLVKFVQQQQQLQRD